MSVLSMEQNQEKRPNGQLYFNYCVTEMSIVRWPKEGSKDALQGLQAQLLLIGSSNNLIEIGEVTAVMLLSTLSMAVPGNYRYGGRVDLCRRKRARTESRACCYHRCSWQSVARGRLHFDSNGRGFGFVC